MCLAIAMYLVTGTLSLITHVLMTVGIFLLTLLGKLILIICASIYTVSHRPHSAPQEEDPQEPFVTMYPELYDFEENYEAMKRESLETITSAEGGSPRRRKHHKPNKDDEFLPKKKQQAKKSKEEPKNLQESGPNSSKDDKSNVASSKKDPEPSQTDEIKELKSKAEEIPKVEEDSKSIKKDS